MTIDHLEFVTSKMPEIDFEATDSRSRVYQNWDSNTWISINIQASESKWRVSGTISVKTDPKREFADRSAYFEASGDAKDLKQSQLIAHATATSAYKIGVGLIGDALRKAPST